MNSRFIFLLSAITFCVAFDVDKFLSRSCEIESGSLLKLKCSNFTLIPQEIYEIQIDDFIISNHKLVEFDSCSIGIVNENFFTKFPEAVSINITKCNVSMDSSIYPTSDRTVKLNELAFNGCRFMNNKDTNALNTLNMLEKMTIVDSWFHYKLLDRHFLRNLTNLTQIHLEMCGFQYVESGAFDDLHSLKSFHFEGSNITYLPNRMLEKNVNLETFNFLKSKLTEIPLNFLPKSVERISLESNSISILKKNQFKSLAKLEVLVLSHNKIGRIHKRAFNGLKVLKELNMNSNNITILAKRHFQGLDNLKEVYLIDNQIDQHNQRVLEDLVANSRISIIF